MDIDHLREFVTLASHLKLATAARDLYMSPSTLSQHITALEKEVGTDLFVRSGGLALTVAGTKAVEHAQNILFEYDALMKDCAAQGATMHLSVPNYFLGQTPLAAARASFIATHPNVSVAISTNEHQGEDSFEILDSGKSDLATIYIVRGSGYTIDDKLPEGISYIHVATYNCVFVSMDDAQMPTHEILSDEELNGSTVMLRLCPVCSLLMDGITKVLADYGVSIKVLFRPLTRNTDAFLGDMDHMYMQWFEPIGTHLDPPWPGTVVHRWEHDLIADAYFIYRADHLDDLQLAFLDEVRKVHIEENPYIPNL